jgi:hypothetical protein
MTTPGNDEVTCPSSSTPTLVLPSTMKRLELGTKVFKAPTPSERKSARITKYMWKKKDGVVSATSASSSTPTEQASLQLQDEEGTQCIGGRNTNSRPIVRHQLLLEPTIERRKRKHRLIAKLRMETDHGGNQDDTESDLSPSSIAVAKKRMSLARVSFVGKTRRSNILNVDQDVGQMSSNDRGHLKPPPTISSTNYQYASASSSLPEVSSYSTTDLRSPSPVLSFRNDRRISMSDVETSEASYTEVGTSQSTARASNNLPHSNTLSNDLLRQSHISLSTTILSPSLEACCSSQRKIKSKAEKKAMKVKNRRESRMYSFKSCLADPAAMAEARKMWSIFTERTGGNHQDESEPENGAIECQPGGGSYTTTRVSNAYGHTQIHSERHSKGDRHQLNDISESPPRSSRPLGFSRGLVPPVIDTDHRRRFDRFDNNDESTSSTKARSGKRMVGTDSGTSNLKVPATDRTLTLSNRIDDSKSFQLRSRHYSQHSTTDDVRQYGLLGSSQFGGREDHVLYPSALPLNSADMLASEIHFRADATHRLSTAAEISSLNSSIMEGPFSNMPSLTSFAINGLPSFVPSSIEDRMGCLGSYRLPMSLPGICRQEEFSSESDNRSELRLFEERRIGFGMLLVAKDLTSKVASLQLVSNLYRTTNLTPIAAKIVSEAEIHCQALMEKSFLRQLTGPLILGGLGFPFSRAESMLFLLRPLTGSKFGLQKMSIAKLLHLGLTAAEALGLLPFIKQLEEEVLSTKYAMTRQLLNNAYLAASTRR